MYFDIEKGVESCKEEKQRLSCQQSTVSGHPAITDKIQIPAEAIEVWLRTDSHYYGISQVNIACNWNFLQWVLFDS